MSARPGPGAAIIELRGLACPGQAAPLDLALWPGLSFICGGEGRGKSSLLALVAVAAREQGLGVWLEQPADAAHDALLARDWLAQRRARPALTATWNPALEHALIEALGLAPHLDKAMFMLSAGSRRKLGLLGAAASGARLTLLDTPYAALDARSARVLDELLAEAAEDDERAWVLADYALPSSLAGVPLATMLPLGD